MILLYHNGLLFRYNKKSAEKLNFGFFNTLFCVFKQSTILKQEAYVCSSQAYLELSGSFLKELSEARLPTEEHAISIYD